MADTAQLCMERVGEEVQVTVRVIPDSLDDPDLESSGFGVALSRRDAIAFGLKLIRAAM